MGCCQAKKSGLATTKVQPQASQNVKSIAEVEQTVPCSGKSVNSDFLAVPQKPTAHRKGIDNADDTSRNNANSQTLTVDVAGDTGGHGLLGAALVCDGPDLADTGGKVMEIAAAPLDVGADAAGTGLQMLEGAAAGGELIAETVLIIAGGIAEVLAGAASAL